MKERRSNDTKIAILEENHKTIMEQFKTFNEENAKQHQAMLDGFQKLEDKIDEALSRKADVWVEKAVSWFIYLVMGIVLTGVVYLVISTK